MYNYDVRNVKMMYFYVIYFLRKNAKTINKSNNAYTTFQKKKKITNELNAKSFAVFHPIL